MKKLYLLLLSVYLLFCLDSCRQSDEFELKGELEGITSDMILVVFDDPESNWIPSTHEKVSSPILSLPTP